MATQVLTVANPAAGSDWTFTMPSNAGNLTILAVHAKLVTSATAATRQCLFTIFDPAGNRVFEIPDAATGQVASLTVRYLLSPSGAVSLARVGAGGVGYQNLAIPPITLGVGWQIKVVTAAIDAADQWTEINVTAQ